MNFHQLVFDRIPSGTSVCCLFLSTDKEGSVIRASAQSLECLAVLEAGGASVCQGRRPGVCRLLDQQSPARQEQTTQMYQ